MDDRVQFHFSFPPGFWQKLLQVGLPILLQILQGLGQPTPSPVPTPPVGGTVPLPGAGAAQSH